MVLSVAAGGPSLADTWQALTGVVVTVNGSLGFLKDRGVTPWGCGVMDPGRQMAGIVPRVDGVHYFLASVCDPTLFDHLAGMKVGMWHPGGAPGLRELLSETRGGNWTMVSGGSTMGLRWLSLGYTLGFRHFEFHGLDSSYRGGATHAYPDHTDGADHLIIDGYHTKLAFVRQVSDFFAVIDYFMGPEVDPITIEMHGDGWLQARWRRFKEANPAAFVPAAHTANDEQAKYERMWQEDAYREMSPGEQLVPVAVDHLGITSSDRVIDFGCGPARATKALKNAGCDVLGIDIAENCRDPGNEDVPLRVAVLWDLPGDIETADFGLCCDVMEHIPPERVSTVLAGIRRLTKRGAFFNIAFTHDRFGALIGERLHLTVHGERWWAAKLREHWDDVTTPAPGMFVVRP